MHCSLNIEEIYGSNKSPFWAASHVSTSYCCPLDSDLMHNKLRLLKGKSKGILGLLFKCIGKLSSVFLNCRGIYLVDTGFRKYEYSRKMSKHTRTKNSVMDLNRLQFWEPQKK